MTVVVRVVAVASHRRRLVVGPSVAVAVSVAAVEVGAGLARLVVDSLVLGVALGVGQQDALKIVLGSQLRLVGGVADTLWYRKM